MTPSPESPQRIEREARRLAAASRRSIARASSRKVRQRRAALDGGLRNERELRALAADLRQDAIDRLADLLEQAESSLRANGVHVHWARDGEEAGRIVEGLCRDALADFPGPKVISKSKSMVTEEIGLTERLSHLGFEPVETDLGEFVVQLDGDRPSHITTPIIHKDRHEVSASFVRAGLGEETTDPEVLTAQARAHLRRVFHDAGVGISGANFIAADTGRIAIVSNEGNARMAAAAARVHIAVTGIDKIVARERDLAVLLKLLARSGTGQQVTVYTHFYGAPAGGDGANGPHERHVVFLDNGRSGMHGGPRHEMLRCIRCGACLNACPVYRIAGGHAYGAVYPGPMGAVLAPSLMGGAGLARYGQLPKASSLCGACEDVCPVNIPIPELLLGLRAEIYEEHGRPDGDPPFTPFAVLARNPALWRAALATGRAVRWRGVEYAPVAAFRAWTRGRKLPEWPRQSFRAWWKERGE